MTFFLFPPQSINQAQLVAGKSVQDAKYSENHIRDLVAANIGSFLPDTKLISTEFSQWDQSGRRLDILAIDSNANLYVIELKRNNDGAHAELQALRYAAMMSVCSFHDLVIAGHEYRRRTDPLADKEAWQQELLTFLDEKEPDLVELPRIPRIVLISSKFNKEITTTVIWLNEMFGAVADEENGTQGLGMNITCFEMRIYDLHGQHALHFDQIIPIPLAEDYQVKARTKTQEGVKQLAKSKRARTVKILEDKEKLTIGTTVKLIESQLKFSNQLEPDQKYAIYEGKGRFKWKADNTSYNSLNALMQALYTKHDQPMGSIQAPLFWAIEDSALSLAAEADKISSAEALPDN